MRILYHHRTRAGDAQGVHIRGICSAFRELGHEVRVATLIPARRAAGKPSAGNAGTAGRGLGALSMPRILYECISVLYNIPAFLYLLVRSIIDRPDFIYERYSLFSIAGLAVARLRDIPFVLEVNAPLSQELSDDGGLRTERLAEIAELWLCRNATVTIVVTEVMAEIFAARGVDRDRLLVIQNAVDGIRFHSRVDGRDARHRYGLDDALVIGFVGWARPWHGLDGLVASLAELAPEFPHVRLLIVGDGPAIPELRARVTSLGLERLVTFTGAVAPEEIPEHIAALDIAVQPDVTDYASPIKLFEYLAIGRPIVAPDKPNIREVVRDGDSALLFAPRDWTQLAGRLRTLLADPDLRERLRIRAAQRAAEGGYTWVANAERILSHLPRRAAARPTSQ